MFFSQRFRTIQAKGGTGKQQKKGESKRCVTGERAMGVGGSGKAKKKECGSEEHSKRLPGIGLTEGGAGRGSSGHEERLGKSWLGVIKGI